MHACICMHAYACMHACMHAYAFFYYQPEATRCHFWYKASPQALLQRLEARRSSFQDANAGALASWNSTAQLLVVATKLEDLLCIKSGTSSFLVDNKKMHTHACICMHAYACLHMHACICMPAYAFMHVHAYACMHMHACNACICICICMHACACMHMHGCRNLASKAYRKSGEFGVEIGPFGTQVSPQGQNFEGKSMVVMKTAENLEIL